MGSVSRFPKTTVRPGVTHRADYELAVIEASRWLVTLLERPFPKDESEATRVYRAPGRTMTIISRRAYEQQVESAQFAIMDVVRRLDRGTR